MNDSGVEYNTIIPHRDFILLAGLVLGVADERGLKMRWGGDWDGNYRYPDQSFYDLPHFEVVG